MHPCQTVFYAPANTPIWALYNKCSLQIYISRSNRSNSRSWSRNTHLCLHMSPLSHSVGGPWRLHRSTPETSTPSTILLLPHCQHESAIWVIAPFPTSSWMLVSEGGFIGSDDLRQINGYPIPPGEPYHSYILRSYRPAFLHPEREL
jgi:hypothetical protein